MMHPIKHKNCGKISVYFDFNQNRERIRKSWKNCIEKKNGGEEMDETQAKIHGNSYFGLT